jgi:hypothetical protein
VLAERGMAPEYSYRVTLEPESEALLWQERQDGAPLTHRVEPRTGLFLRALIKMLSWLPIEEEL